MAKKKIKRKLISDSNLYLLGGDVENSTPSSSEPSSSTIDTGNTVKGAAIGNKVGAVASAVTNIAKTGLSNAQIADTSGIQNEIDKARSYVVQANDNDALMSEWGAFTPMKSIDWRDIRGGSTGQRIGNTIGATASGASSGFTVGGPIGAVVGGVVGLGSAIGGWFGGNRKAKNKASSLNKQINIANSRNLLALSNRADTIDTQNDFTKLANYSAYGGPITMRYTGVMSPFGNTFGDGGIFIKPENRGKFTALKERTGKSSTWYKEHGTPAQKKMATFALNAAKWKHADGGPVKKADYDSWYKTVPTDRNDTTSYNLRRAYELAPYSELEAWRTSSPKDLKDGKNHLRSVYLNPETGIYEFMKSKNHPTLHFETEWYNSNGPEAIDFRKNYMLDTSGEYYRYIPRKKAFGGELNTQGGDFTNGLTYIDNGGSHETNPFEGVQMGIDPQGVPNLVEEGEVIFNDYVFSNRLKVPKAIRQKYKLRDNITFADAAKKLSKESEDRPNDPISKRGLESFMSALAESQEEVRIKNEDREMNRYAKGGKLGNLFSGEEDHPSVLKGLEFPYLEPTASDIPVLEGLSIKGLKPLDIPEKRKSKNSYLRYAPIAASGIAVLNDMLGGNEPNYTNADIFAKAIRDSYRPVSTRPIGEYLSYKPFDRMFYINQLNKNSAANRRAIQNTSGGNRAAALASLLASDYNYGENLGKLGRQAEEYNQALKEKVTDFNRRTNMYNSEQGTKVDMFNSELKAKQASLYGQLAGIRQSILNSNMEEKRENMTNFIQGLGDLGREMEQKKWRKALYNTGYFGKSKELEQLLGII